MATSRNGLAEAVRNAVRHFWRTRDRQARAQGATSGKRDHGARSAVTGGAQLDGFAELLRDLVVDAGISASAVYRRARVELPGYYRAEKRWDLLIVADGRLIAAVEFKAHVGPSFGNNYNNRAEEAIGSATDYWAAYREGAFRSSPKPWLGYFMLLENAPGSTQAISNAEPHFPVFEEFRGASYVRRYEILLTRMVRDRLYDAACLILSSRDAARTGAFCEPCEEISFANFAEALVARAIAYSRTRM